MDHRLLVAVSRLGRTGSSALSFLTILLPACVHSQEFWLSLALAAPIFPMSMCTFILNDINDIERDRVNHPERPLPMESVSMHSAAVIYVILFVLSLAAVRMLVPAPAHYVYLGGFLLAVNYNTVVNNLPLIKTFYAAATATTPVLIVNSGITPSPISWPIWSAVLLFIWGREVFMDILDMAGDGMTWPNAIGPDRTTYLAGTLQGAAFLFLAISATTLPRLISLAAILILAAIAALWWRKGCGQSAIGLMKA